MTRDTAAAAAATRLAEIQNLVDSHNLPDSNWAEELARTPDGIWTQAFRISGGRVYQITEIVWIPCDFQ